MARVCVSDDFEIGPDGVLHLADRVGTSQLLMFTTPGTYQFNPDDWPGLKAMRVRVVGGGGGGAGADADPGETLARPGGSGAGYSESVIPISSISGVQTIIVGAGGAGGVGNNEGAPGESSTFGNRVTALGGLGAGAFMQSGTNPQGASGTSGPGPGPNGQIRLGGGVGGGAVRLSASNGLSGAGGDAGGGMGTGGGSRASEGSPFGARGYGAGGGGALSHGASHAGGDGLGGAVFVELYF